MLDDISALKALASAGANAVKIESSELNYKTKKLTAQSIGYAVVAWRLEKNKSQPRAM